MGTNPSTADADTPTKHLNMHAVKSMHFSQSIGIGAFDGQHGMSPAMSVIPDASSAIAGTDAADDASAMTGRDSGDSASPAITRIANRRRMVVSGITAPRSHRNRSNESLGV
jgi:hypothetical protein